MFESWIGHDICVNNGPLMILKDVNEKGIIVILHPSKRTYFFAWHCIDNMERFGGEGDE